MLGLQVKRKRGRPRRDEPRQINDFDESLIREFQKRPALYDRSHPMRSRDTIDIWNEMAAILQQSPTMIKDRMLQLRNRYNLEKRRIESLQEQYNDPNITSQWVLYEKLEFLGDHIKTRRPYSKDALPLQGSLQHNSHSSNYIDNDADDDDNDDDDDDEDNDADVETETIYKAEQKMLPRSAAAGNHNMNNNLNVNNHHHQLNNNHNNINSNNNNSHNNHNNGNNNNSNNHNSNLISNVIAVHEQQRLQAAHNAIAKETNATNYINSTKNRTAEKYRAFGEFLTYSLMEMNDKDALRLVEKFTSEVVKSQLVGLEM